jgi:hypothetical protein
MVDRKVTVILSFDDGPRGTYSKVLGKLRDRIHPIDGEIRLIPAAFFLQNCLLGNSTPNFETTGGFRRGTAIVNAGHYVAIHTGGRGDHVCHRVRVSKPFESLRHEVVVPPSAGLTALDSDMQRAKRTFQVLTGAKPKYVRAVHGHTNEAVIAAYTRQSLENVHWTIDSKDSHGIPAADVIKSLKEDTKKYSNLETLVYLFHDNGVTARKLGEYIDAIQNTLKENGCVAIYPKNTTEVELGLITAVGKGEFGTCKHVEKP